MKTELDRISEIGSQIAELTKEARGLRERVLHKCEAKFGNVGIGPKNPSRLIDGNRFWTIYRSEYEGGEVNVTYSDFPSVPDDKEIVEFSE